MLKGKIIDPFSAKKIILSWVSFIILSQILFFIVLNPHMVTIGGNLFLYSNLGILVFVGAIAALVIPVWNEDEYELTIEKIAKYVSLFTAGALLIEGFLIFATLTPSTSFQTQVVQLFLFLETVNATGVLYLYRYLKSIIDSKEDDHLTLLIALLKKSTPLKGDYQTTAGKQLI